MSKKKNQKNGWTIPVFGPEVDEMEERIRRHYRSSPDHEWLGHLLGVIDQLREEKEPNSLEALTEQDLYTLRAKLLAEFHRRGINEKIPASPAQGVEPPRKEAREWDIQAENATLKARAESLEAANIRMAEGLRRWCEALQATPHEAEPGRLTGKAVARMRHAVETWDEFHRREDARPGSSWSLSCLEIAEEQYRLLVAETKGEPQEVPTVHVNLEDLRKVLETLNDEDDPCRFDHHGYCQSHGWMSSEECYVKTAKRMLAALPEESQKEESDA